MSERVSVSRLAPLALAVAACCAVNVAATAAPAPTTASDMPRLAQTQPGATMELPATVKLTESDVEGFMRAASALQDLGVKADPGKDMDLAQALAANAEAQRIISAAGFTPERLQQVAMSIGMAMAALDTDMEELQRKMAQVEQMKSRVSPEQWAAMEASMGQAYAMMKRVQNQPDGNIDLVKRYETQLRENLGGK